MKLFIILAVMGLCSACASSVNTAEYQSKASYCATKKIDVDSQLDVEKPTPVLSDDAILLSQLLNTHHNRHQYVDSAGRSHFDELSAFKELARLYAKTVDKKNQDGQMADGDLKRIMFFAFYAKVHNNAAINESLSRDLMPIYLSNRGSFISLLAELPFLIASNCERLAANARYSNNPEQLNLKFIENNKTQLLQSLKPYNTMQCLEQFK